MKLTVVLAFFCLSCFAQNTKPDTVTVIGVGDIMMGTNYPGGGHLPPDNGSLLMKEVTPILSGADVTIGNLEGTLIDKGGIPKTCRDPKVCYTFRTPESYAQNLADAGFDAMSVANNHSGDFGWEGKIKTEKALQNAGLQFAGQVAKPSVIFEKNGIKFGFAAFAPNVGCANINDLVTARKIVKQLDSICDIVIVSFHGGAEGPQYQHVPRKSELFIGENRGNVYEFAHQMIDAGADVILGHGPHVTRAVEVYKERFIAYSLGNFCTYGGINVSGINGVAPIVKVYMDSRGVFYKAHISSTFQQFYSNVMIDGQSQALKRIQALSREDFPQSQLAIDANGWVRKTTP